MKRMKRMKRRFSEVLNVKMGSFEPLRVRKCLGTRENSGFMPRFHGR